MNRHVMIILSGLLPATAAPAAADRTPDVHLSALFADYGEWQRREFPELAMARGDDRYADRITDNSLAAIERRHEDVKGFHVRLRAIDRAGLSDDNRLNHDLFDHLLRVAIEGHAFREFLMPVGGYFGPLKFIPQMHEKVRFERERDYVNYLQRLSQVPGFIDHLVDRMRRGAAEGRTPPRVVMAKTPKLVRALLDGGLDALVTPFESMPDTIPADRQETLRRRCRDDALPAIREAVRRMGTFIDDEYLPACRTSIAAADLPDGPAYYAYQLRSITTTDLTASEIHALGRQEIARIRLEMLQVIRDSDFLQKRPAAAKLDDAALFRAFVQYLRTDPRFYHRREADLLTGYRDICKRVDAELPRLFRTLPRLTYGVREIPDFMAPNQTTAYYSSGNLANGRSGTFYANTYALDQRPIYEMVPLALHEAVPGHHLQGALAQELEDVPEFRRYAWFTAFGEGWALYAERLGLEMGLYEDPYDNFGRLLYEMWRSCRLVVDTGIHAHGWSREQAVQFMLDNTALSELNVNTEVDRYIIWPGQATAYKIGELRIRQLRKEAETALAERFDVRAFHDAVLGAGSIPLDLLEHRVRSWIRECQAMSTPPATSRPAPTSP
jgi:uncharacterized protein (DUF885 family)